MRPSLVAATIRARIKEGIRRPLYIVGSPGLGKTQLPKQVAEDLGIGFQCIHVPTLQPEDCGLPIVNAERDGVRFVVPNDKFPFEDSDWPDEGILVLDELAQADNALQKIMANLMQEREMHGRRLKEGWTIIATGNRATDRAGANRILSHLQNRMTTIQFEPNLDDWCEWAFNNNIRPEVIQFARWRPNLLSDFDPQRDINPTPRAWSEGVSPALGKVPPEAEFEMFAGDVGEGAASEFVGFLRIYRQLPDPDVVLKNPDTYEVPTDPATLYALAGAIAQRADGSNTDAIMTFARRMPAEFTVLVVRDAVKKCPEFQLSKAFSDWATTDGKKLLI